MQAIFAFTTILFQSLSPVRHAFYEAFLHSHIALAIMAFVGLWYHLEGMSHQYAMLVTVVLWGFDVSILSLQRDERQSIPRVKFH